MGKPPRPTLWIPLAFLTLAVASALVWSAFVSSAPTEATILVRRAGMPVAGVRVAVFLVPFEEGTGTGPAVGVPTTSPALARGETAADGRFTAALDMVPTGPLADPGDGNANAFNTIVIAEDPSGGLAIRHEIMRVGERNPVVIDLDAQGGTTSLVQPQADAGPLVVDAARVERGIGTAIRTVKMQASPNLGYLGGTYGMPGGIYVTDPPVAELEGVCHSPKLLPLKGFRLSPGQEMRVWMVLEAVGPGRYRVPSHTVTYRQEGTTYQQVVPVGYEGKVEPGAEPPHPDRIERPCLDQTTALG